MFLDGMDHSWKLFGALLTLSWIPGTLNMKTNKTTVRYIHFLMIYIIMNLVFHARKNTCLRLVLDIADASRKRSCLFINYIHALLKAHISR